MDWQMKCSTFIKAYGIDLSCFKFKQVLQLHCLTMKTECMIEEYQLKFYKNAENIDTLFSMIINSLFLVVGLSCEDIVLHDTAHTTIKMSMDTSLYYTSASFCVFKIWAIICSLWENNSQPVSQSVGGALNLWDTDLLDNFTAVSEVMGQDKWLTPQWLNWLLGKSKKWLALCICVFIVHVLYASLLQHLREFKGFFFSCMFLYLNHCTLTVSPSITHRNTSFSSPLPLPILLWVIDFLLVSLAPTLSSCPLKFLSHVYTLYSHTLFTHHSFKLHIFSSSFHLTFLQKDGCSSKKVCALV